MKLKTLEAKKKRLTQQIAELRAELTEVNAKIYQLKHPRRKDDIKKQAQERREECRRLYAQLGSYRAVAEALGISAGRVSMIFQELNRQKIYEEILAQRARNS